MTGTQIRCPAKVTHGFIQLVFVVSSVRGAREPNVAVLRGDPVEGAGRGGGEAASLVVDCGSVAAVDEVDEEGAGRGGCGVGEEAAVGVYVGGLELFGVLWNVVISRTQAGTAVSVGREGVWWHTRYVLPSPLTNKTTFWTGM